MRKIRVIAVCLLIIALISGCGHNNKPEAGDTVMYYLNTEGDGLVVQKYDIPEESTTDATVKKVVQDMEKSPDSIDYNTVFPEDIKVNSVKVSEENANLDFNSSYNKLNTVEETLFKAAIVQTLGQISGISTVTFTIEGKPLKNKKGNEVGFMRTSDFVQNVGSSIHTTERATIVLYFGDEKGEHLVENEVSVRYNSNSTIEKLIVEQLMKGPVSSGQIATIPPEATLLSVTVKDGICYVNFSEGFEAASVKTIPEVTIYSIVNSITTNSDVNKVQILIAGETNVMYQGVLQLSKPLEDNKDIIK